MKRNLIIGSVLSAMVVLAVAGIAIAQAVPAVTVTLGWTAPVKHSDGSVITAPLTYNIYGGLKGTVKTTKLTSTAAGELTATITTAPTTCFELTAVESGAGESIHTAELCPKAIPEAPSGFKFLVVIMTP